MSSVYEPAATLAEFAREREVPGAVLGIARRDEPLRAYGFGLEAIGGAPIDECTSFRIASMTKCFTALALLRLRDDAALLLDDPVERWIPEFARVGPRPRDAGPVTLRHLLTHTAGFVNDDPWADRMLGMGDASFIELVENELSLSNAPAIAFEYANIGYALLGAVIARASKMTYQRFVTQTILNPLGMHESGFDSARVSRAATGYRAAPNVTIPERIEPDGAFAAIGGLWTTARDYAAFCKFVLSAWPPRDDPDTGPVRRATVRELATGSGFPQLGSVMTPDGETCAASVYGNGMVCSIDATLGRYLNHSGGLPGFGSHVLVQPEQGRAFFAFGNRTYAPMFELTHRVAALEPARAELLRESTASDTTQLLAAAIRACFEAADITELAPLAAENFFLDRPADERAAELRALSVRFGPLRSHRLTPTHTHAAQLELTCERGTLRANFNAAPLRSARLQTLTWISD